MLRKTFLPLLSLYVSGAGKDYDKLLGRGLIGFFLSYPPAPAPNFSLIANHGSIQTYPTFSTTQSKLLTVRISDFVGTPHVLFL